MLLLFMENIASFDNEWQLSKDPLTSTIVEGSFETSESNLLAYGRLLEVRPMCKGYCVKTGCDWTKDWACPWSSHEGDEGWAADDRSIGFECCCIWRSSEKEPCGGTANDDPTRLEKINRYMKLMKNMGTKWLRPLPQSVAKLAPFIIIQNIEHSVLHNFMHVSRFVEAQVANQVLSAGFASATLAEMTFAAGYELPKKFFSAFWEEVQTLVTEPHNLIALILLIFVALIPKAWTIARLVSELLIKIVLTIVDAIFWGGFWQAAVIILVWQLYVDSCHPESNLGAFLLKNLKINIHDSKPCKAAVQWQKWMDAVWGFLVSMLKKAYTFMRHDVPNKIKQMQNKEWQSKQTEKAQDNFLNEMDPPAQKQLMGAKITDLAGAKFNAMSNSVSNPESRILGENEHTRSKKSKGERKLKRRGL